jgi:TonB family protein
MTILPIAAIGGIVLALLCLASGQQGPLIPSPAWNTNASVNDQQQSEAGQIVPGHLIHRVDAKYPKETKKSKLEGTVVLQATIDKEGSVSNLAISSGDLTFADAAVDAVRDWKFEPYMQNGQPVQVRQELAFKFTPDEKIGELNANLSPPTLSRQALIPSRREDSPDGPLYEVGHGVTPPRPIYAPDPPYSETARKSKYQGTCVLSLVVGADGRPQDIKVDRALGMGLDQKAVDAISGWKFEPGTKNGEPVAVYIVIEVSFHLY